MRLSHKWGFLDPGVMGINGPSGLHVSSSFFSKGCGSLGALTFSFMLLFLYLPMLWLVWGKNLRAPNKSLFLTWQYWVFTPPGIEFSTPKYLFPRLWEILLHSLPNQEFRKPSTREPHILKLHVLDAYGNSYVVHQNGHIRTCPWTAIREPEKISGDTGASVLLWYGLLWVIGYEMQGSQPSSWTCA